MADVFQVGQAGTLKDRHEFEDLGKALEVLDHRLDEITGPYRVRRPDEEFGTSRPKEQTIERVKELLEANEGGLRLAIRGSDPKSPPIAIRRTIEMDGSAVLDEAVRYLGVKYVFGDMNPKGPEGGKGAQVDCSGLVCICYAMVDVYLPHRAEAIHHDHQVELFEDPGRIRPGDIVLYHTGSQDLPKDQADHCAILVDRDRQIAAPGTGQLVQRQPVDHGSLLTYAYVGEVTGPH
jgi:cell wall-associated NlpC family hydrolase